jgi:hypothetical protein
MVKDSHWVNGHRQLRKKEEEEEETKESAGSQQQRERWVFVCCSKLSEST